MDDTEKACSPPPPRPLRPARNRLTPLKEVARRRELNLMIEFCH
jgi:hypothetical protein